MTRKRKQSEAGDGGTQTAKHPPTPVRVGVGPYSFSLRLTHKLTVEGAAQGYLIDYGSNEVFILCDGDIPAMLSRALRAGAAAIEDDTK